MADILFFPAEHAVTTARRSVAPQLRAAAIPVDVEDEAWPADDDAETGGLEAVASLAAAPSQSLAVLATKMEVLVARLAPDDGTDAGLCLAEASLLRSVLRDLRAFVRDAVFAAQGADLWPPVSTGANLVQGTGVS